MLLHLVQTFLDRPAQCVTERQTSRQLAATIASTLGAEARLGERRGARYVTEAFGLDPRVETAFDFSSLTTRIRVLGRTVSFRCGAPVQQPDEKSAEQVGAHAVQIRLQ